jgi:FtsH-binding integral membrane protein
VIPFIWAGALSIELLAQTLISEAWAKWAITIVVLATALSVSMKTRPQNTNRSVVLLIGLALLFTFAGASASIAETGSSPVEVANQAKNYSTID